MPQDYEKTPTLSPYYDALDRLIQGKPITVTKGTKISLKSVALEAGKSEGSIKKSRAVYSELILEIKKQARLQLETSKPGTLKINIANSKAISAKAESDKFEEKYKQALNRELMLLIQLDKIEEKIRKIDNVVPIKKK